MSDCAWGLLDGINEDGLAVSLSFGGRRDVGEGFGVPLIVALRAQDLQPHRCRRSTGEDPRAHELQRDPGRSRRRICDRPFWRPASAAIFAVPPPPNHQQRIEWQQHPCHLLGGAPSPPAADAAGQRARRETLIGAFLRPPIYSTAFDRGFGTVYSAYWPNEGARFLLARAVAGRSPLRSSTRASG